jgi:multidrug resistance efflux pump
MPSRVEGPEVTVVTVGRSRWERSITPRGIVIAAQSVDLYAKISGYVSTLPVDIGSRVKRGDLVAELFDPELAVGVEKARAEVERARARVTKAEASIKVSEAATFTQELKERVAKFSLVEAETSAHGQKIEFDYVQELAKRPAVGKRSLDESAARYAVAEAAIGTARSQLEAARAVAVETKWKTDEARADLAEAVSNLRIAEAGLHSAEITEPVRISRRPQVSHFH